MCVYVQIDDTGAVTSCAPTARANPGSVLLAFEPLYTRVVFDPKQLTNAARACLADCLRQCPTGHRIWYHMQTIKAASPGGNATQQTFNDEIYGDATSAILALARFAAPLPCLTKKHLRHIAPLSAMPAHQLELHRSVDIWRNSGGILTAETERQLMAAVTGRGVIIGADPGRGPLVLQYGAGFVSAIGGWLSNSVGRPIATLPDAKYARWTERAYCEATNRGQPHYDEVDSYIAAPYSELCRQRYHRLILPLKMRGANVLFVTTQLDPGIDLRSIRSAA